MGFCRIVFYSPDSFFVNAPDDGYMCLSSATLLGVGVHSLLFNIMFLLLDLMFPLFLFNCYPHFSSHSPHLRLPSELEDILVGYQRTYFNHQPLPMGNPDPFPLQN